MRTQLKQKMLRVKVGKFRLIQSASISMLIVEQLRNHTIGKDKTSEKLFFKEFGTKSHLFLTYNILHKA